MRKIKEYCIKEKDIKSLIENYIVTGKLYKIDVIDIHTGKIKKIKINKKMIIQISLPTTLLGVSSVKESILNNKYFNVREENLKDILFNIDITIKGLKNCKDITNIDINNISIFDRACNMVVYEKSNKSVYYVNAS